MKFEIDVKIDPKRKVEEEKPQQGLDTIYPTKPFGKRQETQMTLDILFYNGATKRDQNDASGFSVWEKFDDPTIQYDQTHETADWNGDSFSYRFVQNIFEPTDDDYAAFWGADNPYDRQPLEKYQYGDIERNGGIIPCGAMKSNIEVALVDGNGNEIESISAYKLLKNELPGNFIDATEGMGYRWLNPPAGYHVKVTEKTAKSHYTMAAAGVPCYTGHEVQDLDYGWNGWDLFGLGEQEKIDYTMENLFWHTFDTSDTDNFKLTKVPRYNCAPEDEYQDNQVLKLDSVYLQMKLFLVPRPWHGIIRFSTYTAEYAHGLNSDVCYGIWSPAPRNYMMPTPRTSGQWEIGIGAAPGITIYVPQVPSDLEHPPLPFHYDRMFVTPIDDPMHGSEIIYTGEEPGIIIDLVGDSEQDNGFHLLHTLPCLRSFDSYQDLTDDRTSVFDVFKPLIWEHGTPYWDVDHWTGYGLVLPAHNSALFGQWMKDANGLFLASADGLYRWNYGDWHAGALYNISATRNRYGPSFGAYTEDHYKVVDGSGNQAFYFGRNAHNNFLMHLEGFWGSAPDGKVLTMSGRETPSGISPLKSGVTLSKQPLVYAPDDYVDKTVETVIVEHFLTRPSCNRSGEDHDSYMVSIGEAKEGDLVGVIVIRDSPVYVWRKTNEDIQRLDSEENELVVGGLQHWQDVFKSYKLSSAIPCPDLYNMIPNTFQHLYAGA